MEIKDKIFWIIWNINLILILMLSISLISGAQCVPSTADEFILCNNNPNCEFGLKQEINNVTINFKLLQEKDVEVSVLLCSSADCSGTDRLDQKRAFPVKKGDYYVVEVNCQEGVCLDSDKIVSVSKDYYIKAIIDPYNQYSNPDGLNKEVIKKLSFKKTLEIKLNCPLEAFVNEMIECSFEVEDVENPGLLISFTPSVNIEQGGNNLEFNLKPDSVSFSSSTIGDVYVEVTANSEGYISDTEYTQVMINLPTQKVNLYIDGKELSYYSGEGIASGLRNIKIEVFKGTKEMDVNKIELNVVTPSGQEVPITTTKSSKGTFSFTYNFEQQGTTYVLKYTIYPEDVTDLPFKVENNIIIAGAVTQAYEGSLLWWAIGISAVIVVVIIVLIIIIRLVR